MLTAHYCAFDRQTPLYVKVVLVGAMVYFVVPDDLIPDSLSLIGSPTMLRCYARV